MINRNNYEEYFLLLADKELAPVEEAAVKQFAAKHPDLQEELNILLSCRLDMDVMPVFPKERLLRTALWNTDNPEPIHTQMLLLLDGELSPAEQQQLQTIIAASTAMQAEWQSLQQTKLVAAVIAHPNKEVLHRNDRKVRPLVWMRWAAAAAVVTGLGWLLWAQQEQKTISPNNTLAITPADKKIVQSVAQQTRINPQPVATTNNPQPAQAVAATITIPEKATTASQHPKKQLEDKQPSTTTEDASKANSNVYPQPTPTEPDPVLATLNSSDVQLTSANGNESSITQVAHLSAKPATLSMLAASQKQDVFTGKKGVAAGEEDDYVTVGGARINKQKMRGLFRNVTRSVARSFSKSKLEPDVYATR